MDRSAGRGRVHGAQLQAEAPEPALRLLSDVLRLPRLRLAARATGADATVLLAEIAHIEASSDGGPRSNAGLSDADRDAYENLLLLCPTHHTLVDKQSNSYTVADLRDWKKEIEDWVEAQTGKKVTAVTFAELQVICQALLASQGLGSTLMIAVPPAEKMTTNALTARVGSFMTMGLAQAPQVANYLQDTATRLDPTFPRRLRAGFVHQYDHLHEEGLVGDALFFGVLKYAVDSATPASASHVDAFTYQAAALAVLCHLFQICEVFEAPVANA